MAIKKITQLIFNREKSFHCPNCGLYLRDDEEVTKCPRCGSTSIYET